jgi:alanine racemase
MTAAGAAVFDASCPDAWGAIDSTLMELPDERLPAGPPQAMISLAAVRHNLKLVREAIGPGVRICTAVKANAYGHGVTVILPALREAGVDIVAVATFAEAIELRELHWRDGILAFGRPVLGSTPRESRELACEAIRHSITCTITTRAEADSLADAAARMGRPAGVHVKLDSGMGRAGLLPADAIALVRSLQAMPGVRVEAVYTHFATSDEADLTFARRQLATFREAVAGLDVAVRHAANSAAIFRLPESHFDMVRPGVEVYGYWPDPNERPPIPLRPCLRLVGRLVSVKRVAKGSPIGYGCTFVTQRDSVLALVPIGYEDGYLRSLSNRAVMTLRAGTAQRVVAPVVGRVSMDQTILDVTDVPDVREGESVVIIDDDPDAPNSVAALARLMNTIPYEVTCGLGRRIQRVAAE